MLENWGDRSRLLVQKYWQQCLIVSNLHRQGMVRFQIFFYKVKFIYLNRIVFTMQLNVCNKIRISYESVRKAFKKTLPTEIMISI